MKTSKIEVYKDRNGEYRWRLVSSNGKVLADSGEGYKRKYGVIKAIAAVRKGMCFATTIFPD